MFCYLYVHCLCKNYYRQKKKKQKKKQLDDNIFAILFYLTAYPPPIGIHLSSANPNQLTFAWNLVAQECSALLYNIYAQNCGDCPSRTHHDTAACSDYSVSTEAVTCSFVLQTVFCGDDGSIGNRSNPVEVILKGTCNSQAEEELWSTI